MYRVHIRWMAVQTAAKYVGTHDGTGGGRAGGKMEAPSDADARRRQGPSTSSAAHAIHTGCHGLR